MEIFIELTRHLRALQGVLGTRLDAEAMTGAVTMLDDDGVVAVIRATTATMREAEKLRIVASGVVSARSAREAGHDGLAQAHGHRSRTSLIPDLTGSTRGEAARQVRLGESFLLVGADDDRPRLMGDAAPPSPRSWRTVLRDALLAGEITSAQHDVVLRGLGDPPPGDEGVRRSDADAWTAAATRLVRESAARTVEDLAQAARCIRDLLDPAGAERRFDERHAARSFRIWRDQDGVQRGSFRFDDEGAAWTVAVLDAALRPRRGGPRFVDPAEKAEAEHLIADPRTNEQLQYDLIIDLLRAGTLAEPKIVFGTRQAGVRVVVTADAIDSARHGRPGVAVLEDTHQAVPTAFAARHASGTGVAECTLARDGNPLYQGREARLFTPKQRVALTIRDGGCRWIGCDRPVSYGEAHHIDEYAHGGKTDIDRGILLCRFHHMELHHGGWRITRDRLDDFVLHPPPGRGSPIPLRPPVERRYAWGDLRPPPTRFRVAA